MASVSRYRSSNLARVTAAKASSPKPSEMQLPPQLRQDAPLHLREVVGTQRIARGDTVSPLSPASQPFDLMGVTFQNASGDRTTVQDFIGDDTDAALIMHEGCVATEWYGSNMTTTTNHGLASLSRNLIASSIAILAEQNKIELDAPVQRYIPEMSNSGFAGATIHQLLDMRSGVTSSVYQAFQSMGWAPPNEANPSPPDGLHELLLALPKEVEHGGPFKYRTGDTDLLGWVCEKVTGESIAETVSRLVWQPMGAQQDADIMLHNRVPLYSGGMTATLRDAARFGCLWLNEGAVNGQQVVPAAFVHTARHGDQDAQDAFLKSAAPNNKQFFGMLASPGKLYKNQTWNLNEQRGTILMYGAQGQFIYIDPPAQLVCTVMSHWPGPFIPERVQGWLNVFEAVRAKLAPDS